MSQRPDDPREGEPTEATGAETDVEDVAEPVDVEVEEVPPEEEEAERRGGRSRWRWIAAGVAVVLLIGILLWPLAGPSVAPMLPAGVVAFFSPGADPARMAALEARLTGVEDRLAQAQSSDQLAALESRLAAVEGNAGASPDAVEALNADLNRLNETAASLEQQTSTLAARVAELEPLQNRIDELRAELDAVAAAGEGAGAGEAAGPAIAQMRERTAQLEERLAVLEQSAGETDVARRIGALQSLTEDLSDSVSELSDRLVVAEAAANRRGDDRQSAARLLAVNQLREASRTSAPFAEPLAAVRALGMDDPAVETLARYADAGVPTLDRLRRQFPAVAADAVRAAQVPPDKGWINRTLFRLSSLVTVRRKGEVAGDGAGAIVARAETRLAEGDLAAAVAEVEALDGAAAERAQGWLDAAQARLAVDRAVAELHRTAVGAVGSAEKG